MFPSLSWFTERNGLPVIIDIKNRSVHYGDMRLPRRQEMFCTNRFIYRYCCHGTTEKLQPGRCLAEGAASFLEAWIC